MLRHLTFVVAVLFATGCASKPPASSDTQRPTEAAAPRAPLAPSAEALPPPDAREAALASAVLEVLEHAHLLGKTIDDDVARTAFATYLDRLDNGKLFLLAADREALQQYADKIDDELRSGRLDLAHDGAKIFVTRVEAVDAMIQKILAAPMNFGDEEYVELDPKKIAIATTDAELETRWRQRLELEVMERVAGMEDRLAADKEAAAHAKPKGKPAAEPAAPPAPAIPATPELREAKARADLAKAYGGRFARLRSPDKLDAASDLINALTAALDPHTDYLPPAEKANFDIHMTGSLQGIGAVLREREHYTEIAEIVPGGASARMGKLQPGDLILSVAQDHQEPVDIADMNINDVVAMIRGPKGTVVHLKVQKATGAQETYAITRDVVIVEETYARGAIVQKKGGPAFGYIYLPSFYGGQDAPRSASGDVHRLLQEMHARKVAGVVLDLRGNGGGFLEAAVDITGDLVDQGPVVQVRDGRGQRRVLADDRPGLEYDGPVIVMVDRFSASASEIVAGALQDYHRALIVGNGSQTHGKGTVQSLIDLDQGGPPTLGVLKVTIQQFFRPDGASTQLDGVKADIALPDPDGHIEAGERTLDRPVAFSQIEAAPHVDWKVTWDKEALARKSAARVAKQPLLSRVATATALLKTRLADTRVLLARAAWDARRAQQKRELDAAAPDLKAAPARFTVTSIARSRWRRRSGQGSAPHPLARGAGEGPVGRRDPRDPRRHARQVADPVGGLVARRDRDARRGHDRVDQLAGGARAGPDHRARDVGVGKDHRARADHRVRADGRARADDRARADAHRRDDLRIRCDPRGRIDADHATRREAQARAREQRLVRLEVAGRGRVLGEVAGLVLPRGDPLARAQPRQVALADHAGLAIGQAGDHARPGHVHATEHVLAVGEHVGDAQAAVVLADIDRAPGDRVGHAPHHHHAEHVAGGGVRADQRAEIDIEDQLAVERQERLVRARGIEQRERVLEPAAGAEDRLLVAVLDARPEARPIAELALDDIAAVVDVDDEIADPVTDEVGDAVAEDRQIADRQHRLGSLVRQGAQAGAVAGTEEHRAHARL